MNKVNLEKSYQLAKDRFAALGVDTEKAINTLAKVPIPIHCWQGDDVGGFENAGGQLGDGLAVTGNYPGKARTPDQLRGDFEKANSLIPGKHRFNLHACYAEMAAGKSTATKLASSNSRTGWTGPNRSRSDWISTRPTSRIRSSKAARINGTRPS